MKALVIIAVLIVWSTDALTIVQGPQVGNNKPASFITGWQTDSLSDSRLEWGLSPDALSQSISNTAPRTWHVLTAENLQAETKYYYRVTSGGITSPVYYTRTAVRKESPFEFGLMTDTHSEFAPYTGYVPDFWFNCGDVLVFGSWENMLDYKKQSDVVEHYVPIYEIVGNHDGGVERAWANTDSTDYGFILPDDRSNDNYFPLSPKGQFYSFDYGNVHFQVTNIYEFNGSDDWFAAALDWMADDLRQSKERGQIHNIGLSHYAPEGEGTSFSDPRLCRFFQVLDTGNVELFFHGHWHGYDRRKVGPFFGSNNVLTVVSLRDKYGGPGKCRVDFRQMTFVNSHPGGGGVTEDDIYDSITLRPDIPQNLRAVIESQTTKLSWDKVPNGVSMNGVGGYNIYRSSISYNNVLNTTQSQYVKIGGTYHPTVLFSSTPFPCLINAANIMWFAPMIPIMLKGKATIPMRSLSIYRELPCAFLYVN